MGVEEGRSFRAETLALYTRLTADQQDVGGEEVGRAGRVDRLVFGICRPTAIVERRLRLSPYLNRIMNVLDGYELRELLVATIDRVVKYKERGFEQLQSSSQMFLFERMLAGINFLRTRVPVEQLRYGNFQSEAVWYKAAVKRLLSVTGIDVLVAQGEIRQIVSSINAYLEHGILARDSTELLGHAGFGPRPRF